MIIYIGITFLKTLNGLLINNENGTSISLQPTFSISQSIANSIIYKNNLSQEATKSLGTTKKAFSYFLHTNYLPTLNTSKVLSPISSVLQINVNDINYTSNNVLLNYTADLSSDDTSNNVLLNYTGDLPSGDTLNNVLLNDPGDASSGDTSNNVLLNDTSYYQNSIKKMMTVNVKLDTNLLKSVNKSHSQVSNSTFMLLLNTNRASSNYILDSSIFTLNTQLSLKVPITVVLPSLIQPSVQFKTLASKNVAIINKNWNLNERFIICQEQENLCLNKGVCYKSSTNKFCKCTGNYFGSLCENKPWSVMDNANIWLGTVCGGLLLLLIITTLFVYKKLSKAGKNKKKMENELRSLKIQHVKLIAELKVGRKRFSSSEYSFHSIDYNVPRPYKQSLSDTSKSLEILTNVEISPLSKDFPKNKSNESIFIDNTRSKSNEEMSTGDISMNKQISEFTINKKRKGIWAQEQERKKDFNFY
ncbi:uncharacterized protein LOC124817260 [Hydra vulgaris]|uniref:uncharacterized protein LOC124817260 n=1 Tax=Hydra vulgaris TaxID=6087 RepID=UPI001F5F27DD|nr:uncharacterized protein LOC124817260 [Hydra vulgaris]